MASRPNFVFDVGEGDGPWVLHALRSLCYTYGLYKSMVGDRGEFVPSRSTSSPHHSRTGDPATGDIKSQRNSRQGTSLILKKMSMPQTTTNKTREMGPQMVTIAAYAERATHTAHVIYDLHSRYAHRGGLYRSVLVGHRHG